MKKVKEDKRKISSNEDYSPNNQGLYIIDQKKDLDELADEVNRDWKKLQKKRKK